MMRQIPILYNQEEECCGCTACFAICPRNAITMVSDIKGFAYPKINPNKCVGCYMCLKVCPFKKEL